MNEMRRPYFSLTAWRVSQLRDLLTLAAASPVKMLSSSNHCKPSLPTPMFQLDLKIPPPLVAAITAGAMYGVAQLLPVLALSPTVRVGTALALAAVGASFDMAGLLAFRRAKTTVNPMTPQRSRSVVSTGVYRFTRNPMYLGLVFFLLAWAVYLASAWVLLGVPVFMAYITRFQIQPEERVLAARFGKSYTDYCARVRRWL